MIPIQIKSSFSDWLKAKVHPKIILKSITPVSGGCINNALKLQTNKGAFFAKWNENEFRLKLPTSNDKKIKSK